MLFIHQCALLISTFIQAAVIYLYSSDLIVPTPNVQKALRFSCIYHSSLRHSMDFTEVLSSILQPRIQHEV